MNILLFFVSLYALIGCLQDAFPTKTGFYLKLTLSVLAFVVSIPGLYFSIKSWYDSPFNRFNLLVYNTLSPIFGDQWANFCRKWGINLFCDVVTKSPVKISGVKFLYWRKRGEFTAPKLNDSDPGTHKMYFHKNKFVRCSLVEKPEWDFPGGYKVYTRPEGQYVFVESDLTFAYFRPGVFESLGERRFVIEEMEKNSVFIHRHQSLVDFLMTYNIITEFYNNNYYLYSSLRKDRNNQHNIIHSENLFELIINKVNMEDLVLVVDNQEFYVEGLNYDFDHDNFLNLFEQEGNRKGVGYLLPMVGNMGNVLALLIHNYLFNRFNLRIDQILINLTNKFPIKDPGCPNAKSKLYRAQLAVIYHRMTKLKICTDKTYSCRVESGMEEKLIEYAKENYRLSKALTAGLEAVKKTELERLKNLEEIRDLARSKQAFTDTKQGVQDKEEKSEKVPGGSRQKTHGGIKGIDIEKEIKEVKDNIKDMKKCIDTKAQLRDAFYRDERKFEVTKTDGGKIWVGNNDKIRVVQYPKTRTEKYNIDLNSDEYTNIRKLNDKPKNLEKRTQYEKLVMSTNDEIERMVLPKEECYIIDQGGVGCKVKLEMNSRYSSKIQGIHLYESAYKEDIGAVEKYILESEKKLEKLEQEWIKVKSKKDKKKKEEEGLREGSKKTTHKKDEHKSKKLQKSYIEDYNLYEALRDEDCEMEDDKIPDIFFISSTLNGNLNIVQDKKLKKKMIKNALGQLNCYKGVLEGHVGRGLVKTYIKKSHLVAPKLVRKCNEPPCDKAKEDVGPGRGFDEVRSQFKVFNKFKSMLNPWFKNKKHDHFLENYGKKLIKLKVPGDKKTCLTDSLFGEIKLQ